MYVLYTTGVLVKESSCLSCVSRCSKYSLVIPWMVERGAVTYEIRGVGVGGCIGVSRLMIGGVALGVPIEVVPWSSQVFEKSEVIEQYTLCVSLLRREVVVVVVCLSYVLSSFSFCASTCFEVKRNVGTTIRLRESAHATCLIKDCFI